MPLPAGTRGILTDIEGTTTPISFVHEVLFPYAERRLEEACARAAAGGEWAAAVARLREEHGREADRSDLPAFGNGAPYARWLMERDRKSTGLKTLQGLIWREGYRSGDLRGQVFPDVPAALRAWAAAGIRLRVFSSGSVLAQKLLFASTPYGDLARCFDAFHDTTTGPKREPSSYVAIAAEWGLTPGTVLFLSDILPELEAAAAAGLATGLVVRPGNAPVRTDRHPTYRSFRELHGDGGTACD